MSRAMRKPPGHHHHLPVDPGSVIAHRRDRPALPFTTLPPSSSFFLEGAPLPSGGACLFGACTDGLGRSDSCGPSCLAVRPRFSMRRSPSGFGLRRRRQWVRGNFLCSPYVTTGTPKASRRRRRQSSSSRKLAGRLGTDVPYRGVEEQGEWRHAQPQEEKFEPSRISSSSLLWLSLLSL